MVLRAARCVLRVKEPRTGRRLAPSALRASTLRLECVCRVRRGLTPRFRRRGRAACVQRARTPAWDRATAVAAAISRTRRLQERRRARTRRTWSLAGLR